MINCRCFGRRAAASPFRKGQEVRRLRHYVCPHCGTPVENREVAVKRLLAGKKTILCVDCEKRVPLWDELEVRFASAELQQRAGT